MPRRETNQSTLVFTQLGLYIKGLTFIEYPIGKVVSHTGVNALRDGYYHTMKMSQGSCMATHPW